MSQPELTLQPQPNDQIFNNYELKLNVPKHEEDENSADTELNKMPYAISEEGFFEDEEGGISMKIEERLASKNKKHMALLKKAGILFQQNQAKNKQIKQKTERLYAQRQKLQSIRNQKRRDMQMTKTALADRKNSLQVTIAHQKVRINDLKYILSLLTQLNSIPTSKIPEQVFTFQAYITEEWSRLNQNNNPTKIHCILSQQAIILDNLISIKQQLSKE